MPESSIIRIVSVLVVMLVFGLGWYGIALARLKHAGVEGSAAKAKAAEQAKRCALIGVFLYLVAMLAPGSLIF